MERSQAIADIVAENVRRYERLQNNHDPVTGEGCVGDRARVEIPDFSIPVQYVPVEMRRNRLLVSVAKAGGIGPFLERKDRAGVWTHDKLERELIKLREKYDFQFWAFFEILIDDKEGHGRIPFKLNFAQCHVLRRLERMRKANKPIRLIICKARQWGGSTLCLFYQVWLALKWNPTYKFSVCAQVDGTAASIARMFTDALDTYKPWSLDSSSSRLRLVCLPNSAEYVIKNDQGNQVRRNIIRIGSVESPNKLRGLPGMGVHYSETSVWPDTPGKRSSDLVSAISGGILPQPYTMEVFESTPKGSGNYFHQLWLNAKAGTTIFEPVFVPWFFIPHDTMPVDDYEELAGWLWDNRALTTPAGKFRESGTYFWRLWESGATLEGIEWYRYKSMTYLDHADMASEAPSDDVEAFSFSGTKVFDVYSLDALRRDCRAPKAQGTLYSEGVKGEAVLKGIHFTPDKTGPLKIWDFPAPPKEEQIQDRYLVCVDVGGRNPTSDWTVMRVFDRAPMMAGGRPMVVAQMRYHTDYDLLAYDAMRLSEWYGHALLVIESNTLEISDKERETDGDMSEYILDIIAVLYDNLYARAGSAQSIREGKPRKWGFWTNSSTKPAIIGHLITCVREHLWVERDGYAVEEMALYERNEKGQFSAPPGRNNHDDVVMATAIGLWISNREMETPSLPRPEEDRRRRLYADDSHNIAAI